MLRVAWPTEYFGDGNSFGYSVHNTEAREAVRRAGVEIDPGARLALHVAPAHRFRPLEGKLNILYTAWESTDLTPDFREGLRRADAVVVTARFLVRAIRREFRELPVHYCPLGVDSGAFPFVVRRAPPPGRPFRFLWLGAPNARKGWEIVLEAWRGLARIRGMGLARNVPPAELYVKTSVTGRLLDIPVRGGEIVFDSRRLSREALARVYANAHAFLFPSFGEGFGLTMAEAMATGLAVLFTPWSAMRDLADESCGYPLRYELIRHDLAGKTSNNGSNRDIQDVQDGKDVRQAGPDYPAHPVCPVEGVVEQPWSLTFARASPEDLLRRMLEVMTDYKSALRKGAVAQRRIRRNFTWDRTGRTLAKIVRTEYERHGMTA